MKTKIYQKLIELTNRPSTSLILKRFTQSSVSKFMIPSYKKTFKIDSNLAVKPMHEFSSLHDFFTRQLKEEVRPIDTNEKTIVSPVDAKIESFGTIMPTGTFSVKGQEYSIERLLAKPSLTERFIGGQYAVLYLSPADYHRIHAPLSGEITDQFVSGGFSYPVNKLGLLYGKKPLSDNHRIISILENAGSAFAVIKVGAMFVNSIELVKTDSLWNKGEEVAYFAFGSTVVLLTEPNRVNWRDSVVNGAKVQVGEPLADML